MARFNRINLGGNSDTITLKARIAIKAGTLTMVEDQRMVVFEGYQQGLGVDDDIPAGMSMQAGLLFSGYEYAIRVGADGDYKVGQSLESDGTGRLVDSTTANIIAYSTENVTLKAGELLVVRIK